MSERASEDLLGELHKLVAKDLTRRIASGEAGAAEINAAIKFLKDNGIEAKMTEDNHLGKLHNALPTFDDDEEYIN